MNWKNVLSTVAPTIATALGGPLAGASVSFLAEKFLGNHLATDEDVAQAIVNATPQDLVRLKELDSEFKLELRKLDTEDYKTEVDDRKSARSRAVELAQAGFRDYTTEVIGIIIIVGYFMLNYHFALTKEHETDVVLQSIRDLAMLVGSYYFGSSRGERKASQG